MIFTTSVNLNYLPKARTLAQSIKLHYPNSCFILCLVERIEFDISSYPEFDGLVTPKNVWPNDHEKILFKYDVVEACTAVKGELFCHLLETQINEDVFIYLDPDTQVLSPMSELMQALETNEIILTPHLTEPETTLQAILDNEISVAKHGVFNLGFLGIKRGKNSSQFLRWWADRLRLFSYADYQSGLFTDQKWVDQAPAFFDVFILKHLGYNVAPWNIAKRNIDDKNGSYVINGETPLRFFHFSGLDSGANIIMLTKYANKSSAVFKLRENYLNTLVSNGETKGNQTTWSYEVSKTNLKILKKARRNYQKYFPIDDPYNNASSLRPLIYFIKNKFKNLLKNFWRN